MIVDYFLGKCQDYSGKTINDFLSMNNEDLESKSDWVPFIFPSTDKSANFPNAPILDKDSVEIFRGDPLLKELVRQTTNHYLKFLNSTYKWRNTADSSHIRITRMIRFLATIGMLEEATKVSKWCIGRSAASKKIKTYWDAGATFKPEWEREKAQDATNSPPDP
jgi:hypothetical protein